jgi:hypothetical protein
VRRPPADPSGPAPPPAVVRVAALPAAADAAAVSPPVVPAAAAARTVARSVAGRFGASSAAESGAAVRAATSGAAARVAAWPAAARCAILPGRPASPGAESRVWVTRGAANRVWVTRGAANRVWVTRGAGRLVAVSPGGTGRAGRCRAVRCGVGRRPGVHSRVRAARLDGAPGAVGQAAVCGRAGRPVCGRAGRPVCGRAGVPVAVRARWYPGGGAGPVAAPPVPRPPGWVRRTGVGPPGWVRRTEGLRGWQGPAAPRECGRRSGRVASTGPVRRAWVVPAGLWHPCPRWGRGPSAGAAASCHRSRGRSPPR